MAEEGEEELIIRVISSIVDETSREELSSIIAGAMPEIQDFPTIDEIQIAVDKSFDENLSGLSEDILSIVNDFSYSIGDIKRHITARTSLVRNQLRERIDEIEELINAFKFEIEQRFTNIDSGILSLEESIQNIITQDDITDEETRSSIGELQREFISGLETDITDILSRAMLLAKQVSTSTEVLEDLPTEEESFRPFGMAIPRERKKSIWQFRKERVETSQEMTIRTPETIQTEVIKQLNRSIDELIRLLMKGDMPFGKTIASMTDRNKQLYEIGTKRSTITSTKINEEE